MVDFMKERNTKKEYIWTTFSYYDGLQDAKKKKKKAPIYRAHIFYALLLCVKGEKFKLIFFKKNLYNLYDGRFGNLNHFSFHVFKQVLALQNIKCYTNELDLR